MSAVVAPVGTSHDDDAPKTITFCIVGPEDGTNFKIIIPEPPEPPAPVAPLPPPPPPPVLLFADLPLSGSPNAPFAPGKNP
jgi:hypothetical protein